MIWPAVTAMLWRPSVADSGRDAKSLEAIRALGYITASLSPAPEDDLDVEGLDPKDIVSRGRYIAPLED